MFRFFHDDLERFQRNQFDENMNNIIEMDEDMDFDNYMEKNFILKDCLEA
jgi:hypothetical protein